MNVRSAVKVGAVALASTLVLAACGSKNSSSSKKTVNFEESAEISTMDQSKVTDVVGFTQLGNTQEGLYRLGKKSKVTNALATNTKESKDGKTWTFTLRKNAKWSNGDPVTAKDFVYGWQRTVNPKTASEYAYLFSGIKNADKISSGKVNYKQLGVKADGKYKLVVTLDRPIAYFKLLMGFPTFYPQNQKAVEKYGSKYGTASDKLVYDGPYKQVGWTGTNLNWKLEKNNNYWDKKNVKMDTINYQVVKDASTGLNLYNSKKLDVANITGNQVAQYKNNKDYVLRKQSSMFYLQYNMKKEKVFRNAKIRKAISMSINRNQLTGKVLADGSTNPKGLVSSGLASNPKTGTDFATEAEVKPAVTQNLTEAKKLMAEGLKEEGKSNLTFTLLGDDTASTKQITEFLQSQIEKLPNVKVNLQNVPFKTRLSDSSDGKFDVVLSAWGADFSDPISFLQLFVSGNAQNNGGFSNKQYDALIKASNTTDATNPEKRWDDMVQAEKILMNDQGIAPVFQQAQSQLWSSKLKGVVYNTAGVNFDYKGLYLTK
ncbi:Oligopeptide ABC transporter, periplasmic oligopeptide-binding protein OppA [Pediococcus damnosus]|uniref:Oligopeptide ABC transporter, periplasmic oligopeptide-binding protein OppA n=1 Tax=Pediococcus damnosus TaxID=51663 RepID=A0A0R2HJ37_9LACO|nr:peptide ABC transporter substrate-binding protein [Pediococcus damnosus]AMV63527.1 Oligopeptide ABC transporter, periplasmic oligopeptide-binding protein OppA [Pediococcus damnosus]AMV66534.1 Oligopeptide ABC transporter, periplasmic oligopeptide-binding protein OppA [Pediococcus damnosus]AMV68835.1 Oligopeptide ABC transporter, periplasmic oligopeptide-binding protein OppA [Pediococcus damnosus]KJU74921.1 peptide ABC transporter substrate-binding protein [Pediococcus damnosus LMG 28219]KRN